MEATITTWTSLLQPFLSIFAQPTAGVFVRLLAGWVLCNGRRTVSGMLRWADPEGVQAHDAYHRFFPDAAWVMDELWRRLALLAVALFYPTGVIPVHLDDTLYHRSGRKVEGAGWWRDAVRSTGTKVVHAWGLNLVVLTIQIIAPWGGEPLGLPILMRLHRKNGPTLTALAEAMLRTLAEWLPERRFLACFDGFYATLAGADLPRTHLISRMRRDAAIYDLPPTHRPKNKRGPKPKRGRRLPAPQQMARQHLPWKRVVTIERGRKKTAVGLCPAGDLVPGVAPAGAAGDQPRPGGQRGGRLFLHDRPGDETRRGRRPFCRPLVYRGHLQKYQTTAGRPAVADVETAGARTRGGPEPVAVFDGVAVLFAAEKVAADVLDLALVSGQGGSELRRRPDKPAPGDVDGKN